MKKMFWNRCSFGLRHAPVRITGKCICVSSPWRCVGIAQLQHRDGNIRRGHDRTRVEFQSVGCHDKSNNRVVYVADLHEVL